MPVPAARLVPVVAVLLAAASARAAEEALPAELQPALDMCQKQLEQIRQQADDERRQDAITRLAAYARCANGLKPLWAEAGNLGRREQAEALAADMEWAAWQQDELDGGDRRRDCRLLVIDRAVGDAQAYRAAAERAGKADEVARQAEVVAVLGAERARVAAGEPLPAPQPARAAAAAKVLRSLDDDLRGADANLLRRMESRMSRRQTAVSLFMQAAGRANAEDWAVFAALELDLADGGERLRERKFSGLRRELARQETLAQAARRTGDQKELEARSAEIERLRAELAREPAPGAPAPRGLSSKEGAAFAKLLAATRPAPRPVEAPTGLEWAKCRKAGDKYTNGQGMKLAMVPAGGFTMGTPEDEPGRDAGDLPEHAVRLTRAFLIGCTEVTQLEYAGLLKDNPSEQKGEQLPVVKVGLEGAVAFCAALTRAERDAGRLPRDWEYRLPTEAEWERACRFGSQESLQGPLAEVAWHGPEEWKPGTPSQIHPVGGKKANPLGLHDMLGNAWEMVADRRGAVGDDVAVDPLGTPSAEVPKEERIIRGGNGVDSLRCCRAGARWPTTVRDPTIGFRVVAAPVRAAK